MTKEYYKNNTFEAFCHHFPSRSDFNMFFNNLDEKFQAKFLNCGNYYHYLKFNHGINANIQLIMCLSIVEEIYSEEQYVEFVNWCDKKGKEIIIQQSESFSCLFDRLKKQYYEVHESKQKTLCFFINYIADEDKEELKKLLRFSIDSTNDGIIDNFETFVDIIYAMRCNFVHSARFIPIHKEGSIGGTIRYKGKETFVHSEIEMNLFLKMFEKAFIKYFEEKIIEKNEE